MGLLIAEVLPTRVDVPCRNMNLISVMIGVLVTLFGIYIGQRTGLLEISIAKKALDLSLTKAAPKVGSMITVEERYDNGRDFPAFLYLITTIYNEGELPAGQLDGDWKLTSSYGVPNRVIPIRRDFLGSVPYKFEAPRITQGGIPRENEFRFDVDIEFNYSVASQEQPGHYHAKYRYDYETKRMNKVD